LIAGENIRYVVPHKLDPSHLAEDTVRLQMRAITPVETPVQVTVEDQNHEVIAKANNPYARPGEILTLAIKPSVYETVRKAETLTVNVRER